MSTKKVKVSQGIVLGCEEKLPDGRKYLRFSGIPYAKPPIGKLRFQPPQKLLKFEDDEIDCTKERDPCFHKSTLTKQYVGSEDCLNLNVYVPDNADGLKKFTIMLYIHGGGLKYDSNSIQLYSPEHLLMENVIVVTVNYRLHVLGFLSLPSIGISGNAGLKDQQMAIEWVHENISNFNGDPNNICLFGESAGACCVHFQVLNEKSRKFINSAICQSGYAFSEWAFKGNKSKDVYNLARILGCKNESDKDTYETLMEASVKDIYDNSEKDLSPIEKTGRLRRWRLVIEKESEDAFITQSSIDSIIRQKGQIKIPMIFGSNNGDGMPMLASNIKRLETLNDGIEQFIPKMLSSGDLKTLASQIKRFYFSNRDISQDTISNLVTFFTDIGYLLHQTVANKFIAKYQPDSKQFLYEFQFDGRLNIQKKLVRLTQLPGACHADDVFHLFGGVLVDKVQLEPDSREVIMRKLMCKLWTNFAKYGDPTPDHDNPLPFKWTPVQPIASNAADMDLDYLVINDELKMVRNLNKSRHDFWKNIHTQHETLLSSKL